MLLDLEDMTGFHIWPTIVPTNANLIDSPVFDNFFHQCISFDKKLSDNRQFAWQIEINADTYNKRHLLVPNNRVKSGKRRSKL